MRWIFLSMLIATPCLGGELPFSQIRRKPSLNPYIRMDATLFMPYEMEIAPQIGSRAVPKQPRTIQQHPRPFIPPAQGIRPTGHPTHFMLYRF